MQTQTYLPKTDIVETADGFELALDMPGVPKDGLKVEVEKNRLKVFGRARQQKGRRVRAEYPEGDFSRSFTLGQAVDPKKIEAQYQDGVLTLHLAKASSEAPVSIQIH